MPPTYLICITKQYYFQLSSRPNRTLPDPKNRSAILLYTFSREISTQENRSNRYWTLQHWQIAKNKCEIEKNKHNFNSERSIYTPFNNLQVLLVLCTIKIELEDTENFEVQQQTQKVVLRTIAASNPPTHCLPTNMEHVEYVSNYPNGAQVATMNGTSFPVSYVISVAYSSRITLPHNDEK